MLRVRSALMIFCRMLWVLSSPISPEGMSMDTTWAGEALMYCTTAANPPLSGFEVQNRTDRRLLRRDCPDEGVELVADFGVVGKSAFFQALDVGEAFFRKGAFYVEQIDFYRIVFQERMRATASASPHCSRTGKIRQDGVTCHIAR